jgi:hypothetical protein
MPGKSIYRHVPSSITSSAVRATRAEEVSATSAVGGGPGTSVAGEGSGTSMAGRRLAVTVTWVSSDAGGITTSQFSDDGRATESLSTTTTASSSLGPALVGVTRAAREAGASVAFSPSSTAVTGSMPPRRRLPLEPPHPAAALARCSGAEDEA